MSKDLIITVESHGEKALVGLLENRRLIEYRAFSALGTELLHSVIQGKVTEYAGGLDAAFVNLKQDQHGFLNHPPKPGTLLPVQIVQEERGEKVWRVTDQYSLSGISLVATPFDKRLSLSSKIYDKAQRDHLKALGTQLPHRDQTGYIFRTRAASCSDEEILAEAHHLSEACIDIAIRSRTAPLGTVLYTAPDPILRYIQSCPENSIEKVVFDDKALLKRLQPRLSVPAVMHAEGRWTIRTFYRMNKALQEAGQRVVRLRDGGEIVIDETEACVVIDVNSGSAEGPGHEETIFRTNRSAALEIAHQLRLRNLSGIILIDFIDMKRKSHQDAVLQALTEATASDPEPVTLYGYTHLHLVEMTRKREGLPLSAWIQTYETPCL